MSSPWRSSAALSAWSSLVLPGTTLASIPLLRSSLGDAGLATVLVAWSIARVLVALDLGLLGLVVPNAVESAARGQSHLRHYIIRAVRTLGTLAGAFALIGLLVMSVGVELPGTDGTGNNIRLILLTVAMAFSLQMMTLINGILFGMQRYGVVAVSATIGGGFFLGAIAALVGAGDSSLVVLITAAQYVIVAVVGLFALRHSLGPDDTESDFTGVPVRNWRMQGIGVGGILAGQGPTLAASLFLSPVGIVAVGVGQQYGSVVRLGGLSLGNFFVSRFSNAAAHERVDQVRRAARAWIPASLIGGALLAVAAPLLVRLWLGADGTSTAIIVCSSAAALANASIVSTLVGTSHMRSVRRLKPENGLVLGAFGAVCLTLLAAAIWREPAPLWIVAAVATIVNSLSFNVWAARDLRRSPDLSTAR